MEKIIDKPPVDDFPIYAEFETAVDRVAHFMTELEWERFTYKDYYEITLRRDGPGDWAFIWEGSVGPWGEIKLSPEGDKTRLQAFSLHFAGAQTNSVRYAAVAGFVGYLKEYLYALGLLQPPKPAQPARVDMTSAGEKPRGRPSKPSKPDRDAPLSQWFAYRDALKADGYQYTHKDIAHEKGLSPDYVRQEHTKYRAEHGFTNT